MGRVSPELEFEITKKTMEVVSSFKDLASVSVRMKGHKSMRGRENESGLRTWNFGAMDNDTLWQECIFRCEEGVVPTMTHRAETCEKSKEVTWIRELMWDTSWVLRKWSLYGVCQVAETLYIHIFGTYGFQIEFWKVPSENHIGFIYSKDIKTMAWIWYRQIN